MGLSLAFPRASDDHAGSEAFDDRLSEQPMRIVLALLLALLVPATAAPAAEFRPLVAYSYGGRDDGTFNSAAALGAERFAEHSGVPVEEFAPGWAITSPEGLREGLEQAITAGADPVIAVGFHYIPVVRELAARHPDRRFAILDGTVYLPNVTSVLFREHEGAYLAGMLAAMASKSGTVGFIGGMDMVPIRRFQCGYLQGVHAVAPAMTVLSVIHPDPRGAGFSDPDWGRAQAMEQIGGGADVVFAAAGPTNFGVFDAAEERGTLAIGVDTNQNGLRPGTILTSVMKRLDIAVYRLLTRAREGTWVGGEESLGLAEEGIGWALDQHNAALVTPEMQAALSEAQFDIVAEIAHVHDYAQTQSCQE